MINLYNTSLREQKGFALFLTFIFLLAGGYLSIDSYFHQTPHQNDLIVVNGVFRKYEDADVKYSTDTIYLGEADTAYEVPYFEDNPSKKKTFLINVKQGQKITLGVYKHTGINTVIAIQSNSQTYLSYNDARNYDISANNDGKKFGILFLLLSSLFFSWYLWLFKKYKS